MNNFDDNDPVWKVLGDAPQREASPWFVDRVMNNLPDAPSRGSFLLVWLQKWGALATVCLVFALGLSSLGSPADQSPVGTVRAAVEFEIIRDLDRYLSELESNAWTQNSSSTSSLQ